MLFWKSQANTAALHISINVQEICLYIFNRELLFNHEALLDVGLCAIRCEFFHDIFYY